MYCGGRIKPLPMKLIDTTTTIEQIGTISEENTFKMKSSRKAFQILSDLYSDKPLAIVRELGCNASDAMVAAGKGGEPFAIHLPNALEPWLAIEDFGTGISHENIYSIYATYFESTKTNTNTQIGCLGLGSKSPFCYTDNFVVTSTFNGVRSVYNAYFNEQATPAIALMNRSDTTESNGVKIQIPIKEKDFSIFEQSVKKAFRFFDVKPIITGGKIDWNEETPVFSGNGWKSFKGLDKSYAIMGGVAYPIDSHKVDNKNYRLCYRACLVINFNMGEIDFAPSREHLSYCDSTIKALNDKFEFIKSDFIRSVNESIANQTSVFGALMCVHTLNENFSYIDGLTIKDKILWNGQDITNPVDFISKIAKSGHTMTYRKPSYFRKKVTESMYPSLSSLWVHDDLERGTIVRVRKYVQDNSDKSITVFSKESYADMIASGFPADCFTPASSLPTTPKQSRSNNGSRKARVKGVFNVYQIGNIDNRSWDAVQIDGNSPDAKYPSFYIVKDNDWNFTFDVEGLDRNVNNKSDLKRLMTFLGLSDSDVVMIPKQSVKFLPETSQEFTAWVNENIDLTYDVDEMSTANTYRWSYDSVLKKKAFIDLPATSEFKQVVNYIFNAQEKTSRFKQIAGWIDFKNGKVKVAQDKFIQKMIDKIFSYGWDADTVLEIISRVEK